MYKMAIDLGYGYVKGVNENGKQILFSSVVGPAHSRKLAQVFDEQLCAEVNQDKLHVRIEEAGIVSECFVGSLAEKECRSTFTAFGEEKIYHPSTKALLATAAFLLSPSVYSDNKPGDIHLVTGLPLEYYSRQKERLGKYLAELKITVSLLSGTAMSKHIEFARVDTFPQAGGAMYAALAKMPEICKEEATLALIDVGTKTTDFIVFQQQEGKLQLREYLSGTTEKGVIHMHHDLVDKLTNLVGSQIQLTNQDLRNIIKTGSFFYNGQEYFVTDKIEDARRDLAQAINDYVVQKWSNQLGFMRTVFLAGGGASELYKYLKDIHPGALLLSDAQFANVNGYLRVAEAIQKRLNKAG